MFTLLVYCFKYVYIIVFKYFDVAFFVFLRNQFVSFNDVIGEFGPDPDVLWVTKWLQSTHALACRSVVH